MFCVGCQILDATLIANEFVDDAWVRKKKVVVLKLEFEKAYHRMSWGFLMEFWSVKVLVDRGGGFGVAFLQLVICYC